MAWTLSWLTGLVNLQQGRLDEAEKSFRSVLEDKTAQRTERGFDFSMDYEVINLLGQTLYERAKQIRDPAVDADTNSANRFARLGRPLVGKAVHTISPRGRKTTKTMCR